MSHSLLLSFALVTMACGDQPAPAADPAPRDATKAASADPPAAKASPSPSPSGTPDAESPCNIEALTKASEAIAKKTSEWSSTLGIVPDFSFDAISAVWLHCPGLPDEAKLLLYATVDRQIMPSLADIAAAEGRPAPAVNDDPLDAKLPGHSRFDGPSDEKATKAAWAWRGALLCPDHDTIVESVAALADDDRRVALWDRCLNRFEFVTRDEYIRSGNAASRTEFALHRWLRDSGVETSVADTIARAITLGRNWRLTSLPKLKLPAADVDTRIEDMPLLEVRADSIRRSIHIIAKIDPALGVEGLETEDGVRFSRNVETEVLLEVERNERVTERVGEPRTPHLLMTIERDLPWSTLGPVLASVHRAGIGRIKVIVLANDRIEPLRTVVIHDAEVNDAPLEVAPTTTTQALIDTIVARPGPVRLF